MILSRGWLARSFTARSRPDMPPGMTTSVSTRSMRLAIAFPDLQGFRAGARFQHLIAAILQDQVRHVAQHRFVFHHQNRFVAAPHRRPPGRPPAAAL